MTSSLVGLPPAVLTRGILGPEHTSSQTRAHLEAQLEEAVLETGSFTLDVGYFKVG